MGYSLGLSISYCSVGHVYELQKEQIVPVEINNKVHPETHFALSASSFSKSAVLQRKLQELKDIAPNAAIYSSFSIQKGICNFSVDSGDETVTADECDNNLLPEFLTSLFDYEAVNLEKALLNPKTAGGGGGGGAI